MSSTNKTTNYNLSQFVGTDIPSILNDYNGDMQKIDTAVHNVSVASGDNASDIASLQSTVSGHTNQIAQIDSNVTAVSGRVLTVEGKVTTIEGKVSNIEDVIPSNASASNKLASIEDIGSSSAVTALNARVTTAENDISNIYGHTSQFGETLNYNGSDNMSTKLADALKDFANKFGITNTVALKNNLHSFIVKLDNEVHRLSFNPGGNIQRFTCVNVNLNGAKISIFGFGISASDDTDISTITIGNLSHRTILIDGSGNITVNNATTEEIEAYTAQLQALLFHKYE